MVPPWEAWFDSRQSLKAVGWWSIEQVATKAPSLWDDLCRKFTTGARVVFILYFKHHSKNESVR